MRTKVEQKKGKGKERGDILRDESGESIEKGKKSKKK